MIQTFPDAHAAAVACAESFATLAEAAVSETGRFTVALAGGTGPREAYSLLAGPPYASHIPWSGVHLFWGDDRCVPPEHPRSNFAMANTAFVSRVPIPPANVHRMRGELPAREGADAYARELADFFGPGIPRFDLVHLGVGPDGHTLSLFPFDAPVLRERERTVVHSLYHPLGEWRNTITVPVANAAARVELLATGSDKAAIVRAVAEGPLDPFRLPAQLIRPARGELVWMLDAPAASLLALA
jgi:6-phosphogluconolactonase